MADETRADVNSEKHQQFVKLVEQAIQGDKEALNEICRQQAKSVLFRVTTMLGKYEGAEDISQEVMLRLCTGITSLKSAKSFHPWLAKIIVNEKNTYLSKVLGKGVMMNIDEYVDTIEEHRDDFLPAVWAEKDAVREIVSSLVAKLPLRQREAVVLHYYDNLTVKEASEAMGVATSNTALYLKLAREKIQSSLETHELAQKYAGLGKVSAATALSSALQLSGEEFMKNSGAFEISMMELCGKTIFGETAVSSVAAGSAAAGAAAAGGAAISGSIIVGICAAIACVAATVAVIANVIIMDTQAYALYDAEIIFYGGQIYGEGYAHLNPEGAAIHLQTDGEAAVLSWWISSADTEIVIFRGYGENIYDALIMLREQSPGGEYFIFFKIYISGGATYIENRNFYLRD